MINTKKIGILLIVLGAVAALTAGGLWLYNDRQDSEAYEYSEDVAQTLFEAIAPAARPTGGDSAQAPAATPGVGREGQEGLGDILENERNPIGAAPALVVETALNGAIRYVVVGGNPYIGVLRIPSLNLDLPVNSVWSMEAVKYTPARFSGTITENSIVIGAHRIDSHFGRIDTLDGGDAVILLDVDGQEHEYQVSEIETVSPTRTLSVVHSGYDLTLFTCTYGGRSRVIVRCMRTTNGHDDY